MYPCLPVGMKRRAFSFPWGERGNLGRIPGGKGEFKSPIHNPVTTWQDIYIYIYIYTRWMKVNFRKGFGPSNLIERILFPIVQFLPTGNYYNCYSRYIIFWDPLILYFNSMYSDHSLAIVPYVLNMRPILLTSWSILYKKRKLLK